MATIMGGGGDKASKVIHTIAPLVAAGVGINAAFNAAEASYWGAGLNQASFNAKIAVFVSLVAGPGAGNAAAKALNVGGLIAPPAQFTPQKALNPISLTGAGILIANYVLKELGIPGYSKYVAPLIGAVGAGTFGGGVIGGIFDPPTNPAAIGNPAGRLAF